ncbi:hypothetical protein GQ457_16G021730 [Hibiscus cannabinus]
MPPHRSVWISSSRDRGRGCWPFVPPHEDPPPPPPPAENQEEIPDIGDSGVLVAEGHQTSTQHAQDENLSADPSHEEDLVDTDDETVQTDNVVVNREFLRYLRGQSGESRKPISIDFIDVRMQTFEGTTNVDPWDAEHLLKDLQRYAGGLVTNEKQRCDAFWKGLWMSIGKSVALHRDIEFIKLVARAKAAESMEALSKNERQHSGDQGETGLGGSNEVLEAPGRVVYRSCTFGFDSGIPRVTISGQFCDCTGSRGLHLLVSEPGFVITGKIQAPIAIYYHLKIFGMARPRRGVRGGGQGPVHLDEVDIEQGNEETLPPLPPVGGEANEGGVGPQGRPARVNFSLQSLLLVSLIDSGSTHSYILSDHARFLDVPCEVLDVGVNVTSSIGDTVVVRKLYRRCPLMIQGYVFRLT